MKRFPVTLVALVVLALAAYLVDRYVAESPDDEDSPDVQAEDDGDAAGAAGEAHAEGSEGSDGGDSGEGDADDGGEDRGGDRGDGSAGASGAWGAQELAGEPSETDVGVVRVHDGDSLIARVDGQEAEVRLIGINAPEWGECQYREARALLTERLGSGNVSLYRDVTDRDRYDRMLRYVVADGTFTNLELVGRGLAVITRGGDEAAYRDDFEAALRSAREQGLGMWNPDACGSAASKDVRILEVEEDPPGRDNENLNGEYVVIRNEGEAPVEMTRWKLRDDTTQNRFWFPEGFVLPAGGQVTVHVGQGEPTADHLYWGRRYPVWDNFGDTALLLDPSGNVVSWMDVAVD